MISNAVKYTLFPTKSIKKTQNAEKKLNCNFFETELKGNKTILINCSVNSL